VSGPADARFVSELYDIAGSSVGPMSCRGNYSSVECSTGQQCSTHNSTGGDGVDAVRVGTNAETLSLSLYTVIASVQPPLSDTARDGDIGGLMKQRRVGGEGGRALSDATICLSVCLSHAAS